MGKPLCSIFLSRKDINTRYQQTFLLLRYVCVNICIYTHIHAYRPSPEDCSLATSNHMKYDLLKGVKGSIKYFRNLFTS